MTPIADGHLAPAEKAALLGLQRHVNAASGYSARVDAAKLSWDRKPKSTFESIRTVLTSMCTGNDRCVYCEDSIADEVEHMRPKSLYPSQVYLWQNYVFACGPCNGPKNNKFSVIGAAGALVDVTRKRGGDVVRPACGKYALIDPRRENPLSLLWLDFGTFRYVPVIQGASPEDILRAKYTIEVLRLNERDALVRGRSCAYTGYVAKLQRWIDKRSIWDVVEQRNFLGDFGNERYRGVWEQMKLQRNSARLHEVDTLLNAAPEALAW